MSIHIQCSCSGFAGGFGKYDRLALLMAAESESDQNQNSLLVKRQTDNTTPGGWGLTGGD